MKKIEKISLGLIIVFSYLATITFLSEDIATTVFALIIVFINFFIFMSD